MFYVLYAVAQKISEWGAKFRHNRVTSQINFKGSAEGTTILGASGGMPPGKFCKITSDVVETVTSETEAWLKFRGESETGSSRPRPRLNTSHFSDGNLKLTP